MAGTEYESVLCVKNEVFVYKIPPRPSNRGYRAADWKLDAPDWTGRLRVVAKGASLFIKLEDKSNGELFAQCPVDEHPGVAVEAVMDSSRYFVLRIMDESGRTAFIGIGFADRSDSFDLNVALQDHFKWLKQEKNAKENEKQLQEGPKLDLSFKEGQTITLNLGTKRAEGKARPKPRSGSGCIGLLPPPPGGVRTVHPPTASALATPPAPSPPTVAPGNSSAAADGSSSGSSSNSSTDLLADLGFDSTSSSAAPLDPNPIPNPNPAQPAGDMWGDFTSAGASASKPTDSGNWVQF